MTYQVLLCVIYFYSSPLTLATQVDVILGGNRRVADHIEGSFSGKQIGVVPLETRRQTSACTAVGYVPRV